MRKSVLLVFFVSVSLQASNWASWRGVNSDGVSADTGLPSTWSPDGENLIWKAPYGTRSTPVVVKGNVCMIRLAEPETASKWQEQVICLDEKTGKVLWERRQNVFQTDIPHHRVAWAGLVADEANGNVYSHSISGVVSGYSPDGKLLWTRSLDEEIGRFSGFGGRTVTPILDGDLLIVSFLTAGFGPNFIPRHRYYALDKATGETVWISTPGQAPYDTTYCPPVVRIIGGRRLLIAGNGDGSIYALDAGTGQKVWGFPLSKRGINSMVAVEGNVVFASHSEENIDGSTTMGRLVALDASQVTDGKPKELWRVDGFQAGYSSPALKDGILYHIDNTSLLVAFDTKNGEQLWREKLGIAQRASPVIVDGKMYVSDVDGKLHIFKLNGRSAPERLDLDEFKDKDGGFIQINGSPAVANGRLFFPTNDAIYCIGNNSGKAADVTPIVGPPQKAPAGAKPATLQIVPAEVPLRPGQKQTFVARTLDVEGRLIGVTQAEWSVQGLKATITPSGELTITNENGPQGGTVVAKAAGLEGAAIVRVMPVAPYEENFNSYELKSVPPGWPAARGRYEVADMDGEKVLFKASANLRSQKTSVYFGPADSKNYDIQIDLYAKEQARRLPDLGLVSHRYTLDLQGNKQQLMIRTWPSEPNRFSKVVKFKFDPDVWYTMKMHVESSTEAGPTKIFGKVWKRGEPEPEAWTIEAEDPIGHSQGSPGIYGFALADIRFDNLKVTPAK